MICQGATAATRKAAFPDDEPLEARAVAALREASSSARGSDPEGGAGSSAGTDRLAGAGTFAGAGTILTSPMRAARETAGALGFDAMGLDMPNRGTTRLSSSVDDELRDLDVGDWAGRPIADVAREAPGELARWMSEPDFDGHGGESLEALLGRGARWLEGRAASRDHTVAITHAALVRALVIATLGAPADAFWRIDTLPASVTDLRHDGRRWALRSCGLALPGRS